MKKMYGIKFNNCGSVGSLIGKFINCEGTSSQFIKKVYLKKNAKPGSKVFPGTTIR